MSIEIIPINGKSEFLDYNSFEKSAINILGRNCKSAKIFIFNNFPVAVSVETSIDLLLVIAVEDVSRNYYSPKSKDNRKIYFHNQIIPVKFITYLKNCKIDSEYNNIIVDNESIDYSNEINSIKYSLSNYLENKCDFERGRSYINPLIYIQNDKDIVIDNYLVSSNFDFYSLNNYFCNNNDDYFISYKPWKYNIGYKMINKDIERIVNQASKDSAVGYLTKNKVERIGKQLSSSKKIFEELNEKLIIIKGKAGTGKSSELLLLTMKCISNGQNALYLTYNKLLIFDIAKTVGAYINSNNNKDSAVKTGECSILTLHALFFRLSKSLGVIHVMKAERIEYIFILLKDRMRKVYDFINTHLNGIEGVDFDEILSEIQNNNDFDIATKEVGIDLVNFLKRRSVTTTKEFEKASIDFYNNKKLIVGNIEANKVFISDYYNVLENTLLAINEPDVYFEKFKIQDKFELLEVALKLKDKHVVRENNEVKILAKEIFEKNKRSLGGYRRKRTLFIDEAQDCHRYEKEILISLYGSKNIVVANGGKEQLIRHVELCNWEVSKSMNILFKNYYTRNKSYRVKKTVVDFCNFLANRFQIDLNLDPLESEDEGELIFDFRKQYEDKDVSDIFNYLNTKSEVNSCTPYESLLVLIDSNSQRSEFCEQHDQNNTTANINEYDNIENTTVFKRGSWKHIKPLEKENIIFWDGTVVDKYNLIVPSSCEKRLIYYESCRGLEAWTVACFSLDKFFEQKRKDPDAEKYLMEDLFLSQNNEQRKSMYAATWVLMAITRVIDTLYVKLDNENSELGLIVKEYINMNNINVRELK